LEFPYLQSKIVIYLSRSSANLKVYFPDKLNEILRNNFNEYCLSNIIIDKENSIAHIPEYLTWTESKFLENIKEYKEYIYIYYNIDMLIVSHTNVCQKIQLKQ
jgi:hypothetical protein